MCVCIYTKKTSTSQSRKLCKTLSNLNFLLGNNPTFSNLWLTERFFPNRKKF